MNDQDITIGEVYRLVQTVREELREFISTRPCEPHAVRLALIESKQVDEEKQSMRRGAVAGVLSATGLTIAWDVMRRLLDFK